MNLLLKVPVLQLLLLLSNLSFLQGKSVAPPILKNSEIKEVPSTPVKFVKDPYIVHKWPGFGEAETFHGRLPWYPAYASPGYPEVVWVPKSVPVRQTVVTPQKEEAQDEEDEDISEDEEEQDDEDEEPEDDLDYEGKYHHPYQSHYNKPWRKPKPVGVSSFGFSPASPTEAKATWWGVLRPNRERSELVQEEYPAVGTYPSGSLNRIFYSPLPQPIYLSS